MYPALAVLQDPKSKSAVSEVLWVGGSDGIERGLVEAASIPFKGISAAGLHGVGLKKLPGNILRLVRGFFQSLSLIRAFNPDVLFFTGGYVGFPVALAGFFRKKVIFIPDIEPALTLSALAKAADKITVVADESRAYLPKNADVVVTGYPTRAELSGISKEAAFETFGLRADLLTLFVFGGSKGARTINDALMNALPELTAHCQVLHVTGEKNYDEVIARVSAMDESVRERYHGYPYLHETMGAAFRAADLVVSRAGASTIGEFPLFGVPAILVPYPFAWRYQRVNAEYLVRENAAILLKDEEMGEKLYSTIIALLNDPDKRLEMGRAMASLAKPNAAEAIADVLICVGSKKRNITKEKTGKNERIYETR